MKCKFNQVKGRAFNHGFTLIELMIAVVIVGILSAVAMPAYDEYIKKSRRSDAVSSLLNLQMAQERYRATHTSYASSITSAVSSGGLAMGATSDQGFYDLSMVSSSANAFVISAGPVSGSAQAGDTCTSSHFRVDQDGPVLTDSTKKSCWSR